MLRHTHPIKNLYQYKYILSFIQKFIMRLIMPNKELLNKTGTVDYFNWNYKFPIKYIQKYRFKKIKRLLADKKYEVMLEAGTGSGIFIPELSKHCDKIYAIDIHPNFDNIP